MHTDFWSIFTVACVLLEAIPCLVVVSLAIETEPTGKPLSRWKS